jgi:type II secretory pathway component PulK
VTRRSPQSGAALLLAIAALVVVAAAGAALCLRVSETARSNVSERANLAARYAAQAGVEKARAAIARDPAYAGESFRFDDFDVDVKTTSDADGRRVVRSTAASATSRAWVEATLRVGAGLPVVESWRE